MGKGGVKRIERRLRGLSECNSSKAEDQKSGYARRGGTLTSRLVSQLKKDLWKGDHNIGANNRRRGRKAHPPAKVMEDRHGQELLCGERSKNRDREPFVRRGVTTGSSKREM